MSRAGFKYFCSLCATVRHEDGRTVCGRCVEEGNRLRQLHLRVVLERPQLQHLSIDQVFQKMYAELLRLEQVQGTGNRAQGTGLGKKKRRRKITWT